MIDISREAYKQWRKDSHSGEDYCMWLESKAQEMAEMLNDIHACIDLPSFSGFDVRGIAIQYGDTWGIVDIKSILNGEEPYYYSNATRRLKERDE